MLSGGPGQAGIETPYISYLSGLLPGWDLVELDQRGTGARALRCPTLDKLDIDIQEITAGDLTQRYAKCAASLGPDRCFYTSIDSARDIDRLRAQLGLEKLAIGGTSYGTLVSQIYARMFPGRVERMLLDSVVSPQGVQAIYLDSFAASRRILKALCSGLRCVGVTTDLIADTGRLQQKMLEAPLTGRRVGFNGRPRRGTLGGPRYPTVLFDLFAAGDLNPFAREAYPAAVGAALRGDASALLRIAKASGFDFKPREFSNALFAATTCAEDLFPWQAGQSFADRRQATQNAIASQPDSAYVPWGRASAAGAGELNGCLEWPESPFSSVPAQPLPNVPALLLAGADDERTPIEDAREVGALLPRSTLVEVPNTGHSVVGSATCAEAAVRRFMADRPVGRPCMRESRFAFGYGPIPESIDDLRAGGGASGRAGRTASAVALTILDLVATSQMFFDSDRFPGLRRGYGFVSGEAILMRHYSYVPGVELSGDLLSKRGRLKVGGPDAARGTLVRRGSRITGRLDGKRVKIRV